MKPILAPSLGLPSKGIGIASELSTNGVIGKLFKSEHHRGMV